MFCLRRARGESRPSHLDLSETRHVLRGDPPGDHLGVNISAARNECVSFQILLRSESPASAISVEPGDLKGPPGSTLPASQATLYRQHQLHLETGTYRNDAFKPDWYPDPLIPFEHPRLRQGATQRSAPCPSICPQTKRTASGSISIRPQIPRLANTGASIVSCPPRTNPWRSPSR